MGLGSEIEGEEAAVRAFGLIAHHFAHFAFGELEMSQDDGIVIGQGNGHGIGGIGGSWEEGGEEEENEGQEEGGGGEEGRGEGTGEGREHHLTN